MIVNFTFIGYVYITHDGSMVLLYVVCHGSHQYTPFMLAFFYQHQPDPSWVTCQSVPSLLEIAARNVVHRDMKPENLCPGCELQEMDPEVMAILFYGENGENGENWLVVWNMFFCPFSWEFHHPNWLSYFGLSENRVPKIHWLIHGLIIIFPTNHG